MLINKKLVINSNKQLTQEQVSSTLKWQKSLFKNLNRFDNIEYEGRYFSKVILENNIDALIHAQNKFFPLSKKNYSVNVLLQYGI